MRPRISDKTENKIREWMEEHPEKGISNVGRAIDYIIPKALDNENLHSKDDSEDVNEAAVRQIVDDLLDKRLDD